jgi:hypothetical protein
MAKLIETVCRRGNLAAGLMVPGPGVATTGGMPSLRRH